MAPNDCCGIGFPSNKATVKNASLFQTQHATLQMHSYRTGIAAKVWISPGENRTICFQPSKGRKSSHHSNYFRVRISSFVDFVHGISIPCVDHLILPIPLLLEKSEGIGGRNDIHY
eukprot:Skav204307  [mRNA]  locus=scaffold453:42718:43065:+ [translate_table: standard]